jgi:hypothetical protein
MTEERSRWADDLVGGFTPPVEAGTARVVDATVPGTEAAAVFQCDLYRYWRVVAAAGGFALGRGHQLSRPALRRLREDLSPGVIGDEPTLAEVDDRRLFFTRRLLERLGLLREDDAGRLVAGERSAMARYLALPFAERLRLGVKLWVAGAWWADLERGSREPARLMAPAPPRIALARRRAQQLLGDLPVGAALVLPPPAPFPGGTGRRAGPRSAGAWAATSRQRDARTTESGFGTAQGRPPSPGLAGARSELGLVGGEDAGLGADAPDADLVRAALTGPLCWLGFLVPDPAAGAATGGAPNAGWAGGDMPAGVAGARWRTTGAAAALRMEHGAGTLSEPMGRVVAQPNFEIVALPPLAAPTLCALDTCAEPRGGDRAASYALTRQSFAAACQAGWAPNVVVDRLEAVTGTALPQNVRATVADWARRAERLRLRSGVVALEVRDAETLRALLADPRAAEWVERRVAPRVALIRAPDVAAVRAWLLRRGVMPAVEMGPGDADGTPAPRT